MGIQVFFEKYWPFLVLVLWFGYKWWNAKRVVALLPELRRDGDVFLFFRRTLGWRIRQRQRAALHQHPASGVGKQTR